MIWLGESIFQNNPFHLCGYNTISEHCHMYCVKHHLDIDKNLSLFSL